MSRRICTSAVCLLNHSPCVQNEMHLIVYLPYLVFFSEAIRLAVSSSLTIQKRSGLTPVPGITPDNGINSARAPRIIEGIDLGRGRVTNHINNQQRHHMHPELPTDHLIRPQEHSSVHYEEDKPGIFDRLTGRKRKRKGAHEGAANDHEAGPSDTREKSAKVEERSKKKYRHWYKSSGKMSQKEREATGKVFAAAGAAVSKKTKDIYRAGQRAVRGIRDGCDAACRSARRLASRLRNRLAVRRNAGQDQVRQDRQSRYITQASARPSHTHNQPVRRPTYPSTSSSSSSSADKNPI